MGKLVSPSKSRRAVEHVQEKLEVSERCACRVLNQPRSTQRREPETPKDEPRLLKRIIDLATRFGRYGYRRITELLRPILT